MYTGLQLSRDLDIRVRQTTAGAYLSTAKKNYFLKMAIVKLLEDRYKKLSTQKATDEISRLIQTYQDYTPYNNQVLLKPLHILTITNVSGNIYQVVFDRPHNIDFTTFPTVDVTFNGVVGGTYTNLNGNTYAAVVDVSLPLTAIRVTQSGITGTYTAGSGEATGDYWLYDYYHLLAVRLDSLKNLNLVIKKVVLGTTCRITVGTNNLRTGERLYFESFGGLSGLSGYKYIKKIGERQIAIYNDENLSVATTVTGTYTSGGIIKRKYERYCEPLLSDQKISTYQATELFPLYETNDNRLACYSSEQNTNSYIENINYSADYITVQANIDITDDTTDLLQTYNQEMCRMIIEIAAELFYAVNTSGEDIQILEAIK